MVSAIGGSMSNINALFGLQQYTSATQNTNSTAPADTNTTNATQNTTTNNFDSILNSSSNESTSQQSASANSEMDLNQDGVVTIDEIMKYLEMQMRDEMTKNAEALMDGANTDPQSENTLGNKIDNTAFKASQAISAYTKLG